MARIRSIETLRRYTDLPALLHMLKHCCITLLDPTTWDDTNDSYYLLKYKEKRKLETVLALCLTQADETYYHWRVFSHGPAGVCIDFHRADLITACGFRRNWSTNSGGKWSAIPVGSGPRFRCEVVQFFEMTGMVDHLPECWTTWTGTVDQITGIGQ
jgi:hypothetical protein